jgi:hypothetical protein
MVIGQKSTRPVGTLDLGKRRIIAVFHAVEKLEEVIMKLNK